MIFFIFINRFTNEKSLTQHKEEHAALIQKESENKRKSAPASLSSSGAIGKDAVTPSKKEDGKNNGKQANNNSSSGEVKATCPQCNQTFRRKFNLTIHIDRVRHRWNFVSQPRLLYILNAMLFNE